jgi:hypothetical protein
VQYTCNISPALCGPVRPREHRETNLGVSTSPSCGVAQNDLKARGVCSTGYAKRATVGGGGCSGVPLLPERSRSTHPTAR